MALLVFGIDSSILNNPAYYNNFVFMWTSTDEARFSDFSLFPKNDFILKSERDILPRIIPCEHGRNNNTAVSVVTVSPNYLQINTLTRYVTRKHAQGNYIYRFCGVCTAFMFPVSTLRGNHRKIFYNKQRLDYHDQHKLKQSS